VKKNAELAERLRTIPLFMACSKDECRRIAKMCSTLSFPAGSVLAREGELGREFMVVAEGTADISVNGTTVATVGPGDFFGEVALLDGGPRTATVVATSDVVIQAIEQRDFAVLVHDSPSLARKLLVGVAKRLRAADMTLDVDHPDAG
jgi:CRP-like cAMP-binding protein